MSNITTTQPQSAGLFESIGAVLGTVAVAASAATTAIASLDDLAQLGRVKSLAMLETARLDEESAKSLRIEAAAAKAIQRRVAVRESMTPELQSEFNSEVERLRKFVASRT